MSLKYVPGQTKEHLSQTAFSPIPPLQEKRFRIMFGVPTNVKSSGIFFEELATIYGTLRDKKLKSLVFTGRLTRDTRGPIKTIERNFPIDVYNPGTFSIKSEKENHFEAVLKFDNDQNNIIQYETAPKDKDMLIQVLSRIAVLSALPKELLDRVSKDKPVVILNQSIPKENEYIGLYHANFIILKRGEDGIIRATEPDLDVRESGYWDRFIPEAKKIITESSEVFFIMDGYFPTKK